MQLGQLQGHPKNFILLSKFAEVWLKDGRVIDDQEERKQEQELFKSQNDSIWYHEEI